MPSKIPSTGPSRSSPHLLPNFFFLWFGGLLEGLFLCFAFLAPSLPIGLLGCFEIVSRSSIARFLKDSPTFRRTCSLVSELVEFSASFEDTINLPSLEYGLFGWLALWSLLILVIPTALAANAIWSRFGRAMLAILDTLLPDLREYLESK